MTNQSIQNLQHFLTHTRLIESQHPIIIKKAKELTATAGTIEEKARNIFYFIRDQISYEFIPKFTETEYFASHILQAGKGFCTRKAILFCALARSVGIPAGIYFYDIVDHSLPEHTVAMMKTNNLYHHGIGAFYLHGKWCQYDATLDIRLVNRKNFFPVEFLPDRDCLMRDKTKAGARHIEYVKDYGLVADVAFEEIVGWFKQGYPHLIERYAARSTDNF